MQGASPEREQAEYPMQRSFGKKRKELVIDCASPNTKQVSLNTQKGPPAGAKLTSKTMFSEAGMAQTKAISISRGDLTPNSKYVSKSDFSPVVLRLHAQNAKRSNRTCAAGIGSAPFPWSMRGPALMLSQQQGSPWLV